MGYVDVDGRFRNVGETHGLLSVAQAKAIEFDFHDHGRVIQLATGNHYRYHRSSILAADDQFVIKPNRGNGRLLLAPGHWFDLALPIAFGLADAAVLATLPTNALALLGRSYWEVTADWTGGSSSSIGISSGTAPHNTKGDILGGAGGDVAATLVASSGKVLGTVGADQAAGILLKSGVTVRYDEITSAFTAGSGFAHLVGLMLANPGA
jgi:hypothetical protein